jgi:hypothetical protein
MQQCSVNVENYRVHLFNDPPGRVAPILTAVKNADNVAGRITQIGLAP